MTKFFLIIYNFLFILLLIPFSLIILIFSGKYRKELFFNLPARFACFESPAASKKTIWVHCASLGEIRAVEPVLENLKKDYFIVLTAVTKTGFEYAQKIRKADFVSLLPLDVYPVMRKAFGKIKPVALILVETEIWVSMIYAAKRSGAKVITVNGRMSEKSFVMYNRICFFCGRFINLIDAILARNADDAKRFELLGASKENVSVTGNIKYDRDFSAGTQRKDFGLKDEVFIFSAGSTREGEEEIIAEAYKKLSVKNPDIKFFLAPRHLVRVKKVKRILENFGIKYSLFSELGKDKIEKFVLVDAFGKLQNIYSVSDVCYVGGSIVNKGGQNPIEPAAYAKPVLFGKNMGNFKTESEILLNYGGAFVVSNADDIASEIERFYSDRDLLNKAGQNALNAVNSQKGAVNITIQKLREQLNGK